MSASAETHARPVQQVESLHSREDAAILQLSAQDEKVAMPTGSSAAAPRRRHRWHPSPTLRFWTEAFDHVQDLASCNEATTNIDLSIQATAEQPALGVGIGGSRSHSSVAVSKHSAAANADRWSRSPPKTKIFPLAAAAAQKLRAVGIGGNVSQASRATENRSAVASVWLSACPPNT
eukprot:CAMPEP_0195038040 /NCGR_PEP_ID=MMETSP0326_2-20130528/76405_1 /TAXON_ID=2866 ORGANISM="Crypthecodinium cohnii, Strain Seligo" /NCGR_SAMPLE_ID=MMETSP0326_2 /ASSEMBLY_ACC=CAM_ASM_000348 /LENGTH=176 /DNA_ID=CAMNT_0040064309 /DNA_START=388 /DNA_END=920 /DNA_ORIENTATION=+